MTNLETRRQSPLSELGPADLLRVVGLIREGRLFDLERVRYPGMPAQGPAHVPLPVIAHRSPAGIRAQGIHGWMDENTVNFRWNSEVMIATAHCGAHIDALAHSTVGADDHRFGGGYGARDPGDFGPHTHDAASIPPLVARGVLIDIPAAKGVDVLPADAPITAENSRAALALQGSQIVAGDTVLIRTEQLDGWPDADGIAAHELSGIDHGAALHLAEPGVVAVASNGPCAENLPSTTPGNPHPVHIALLIERGIFILGMIVSVALARKKIHEFCFIALPLKISAATAAMIRPVAIV